MLYPYELAPKLQGGNAGCTSAHKRIQHCAACPFDNSAHKLDGFFSWVKIVVCTRRANDISRALCWEVMVWAGVEQSNFSLTTVFMLKITH